MALSVGASMDDLRKLADKLRAVDKDLPRELRYLLKQAALPIMREQRATLRSLKGSPRTDPDLRDIIASGLRLTVRTGGGRRGTNPAYRIRTTMPKNPDGNQWAILPRGLDTTFNGWRSPYFGNRSQWVHHNVSGPSWFMGPAEKARPDLIARINKLLTMTANEIAHEAAAARVRKIK